MAFSAGGILVPFTDYSRWERRPSRRPKLAPVTIHGACAHGHRQKTSTSSKPALARSSSPRRTRRTPETPAVRLLKVQVSTKRNSVAEYQRHREELLSRNLSLISSIQQVEDETHTEVRELLEKYKKFKGALAALQQRSRWDLEEAKAELESNRERLHSKITVLRWKVGEMESTLQAKSKEMQVLLHYKEKEYPVKQVRIEQLQEQIELLEEEDKAELVELETQIAEEKERCEQQMKTVRLRLESRATEASVSRMQRSVQEKAIQNRIMEKEIVIHQRKTEALKESVKVLRLKIRQLKTSLKELESRRTQPLLSLGKCFPDTEFQLDIPLQQHALL